MWVSDENGLGFDFSSKVNSSFSFQHLNLLSMIRTCTHIMEAKCYARYLISQLPLQLVCVALLDVE